MKSMPVCLLTATLIGQFGMIVSAFADETGSAFADEFTVKPDPVKKAVGQNVSDKKDDAVVQKKCHKCFKCRGEGHVVMNVKEPCDECEGTGVVITERQIKDTRHSTDGYWNYHEKTTRTVQNKQPCKKCGRSGKINVKKEVICSVCKGAGLLTKSGKPYVAKSNGEQKRDGPEQACRI